MALVLANNASTTLASGVNDSATSITVASATGFPSISGSQFFYVTLDDGTNVEIVKVTGVSGTTFTIVRAQDDTSASAFSTGTTVAIRITKLVLKDNVVATLGALAGQTIADSGDLTLDVAGDIILDAADNQIFFKDAGTLIGTLSMTGSDLKFISNANDKDIIFAGTDGGSEVVALTLDMSGSGQAIFNSSVFVGNHLYLVDNKIAHFGAGEDLKIFHDSNNSKISHTGTGGLYIGCLLYTSPSPRDLSTSRMPSSA